MCVREKPISISFVSSLGLHTSCALKERRGKRAPNTNKRTRCLQKENKETVERARDKGKERGEREREREETERKEAQDPSSTSIWLTPEEEAPATSLPWELFRRTSARYSSMAALRSSPIVVG